MSSTVALPIRSELVGELAERIGELVVERMEEWARRTDRSMSAVVREAIRRYISG